MSETRTIPMTPQVSSWKMLQAMVGIGVMCALLIVVTYEGTLPRVKRLRAEALEKAVFRVIPGSEKSKIFVLQGESFSPLEGEVGNQQVVYAGYNATNQLVGVAIEASGQGYADKIKILYGYNPSEQTVVGFYVLESKETPGLGDKIEKDPTFLANFDALDVSLNEHNEIKNIVIPVKNGMKENPWEVDAITGATISSRAIGNTIGTSSQFWVPLIYKNKDALTYE